MKTRDIFIATVVPVSWGIGLVVAKPVLADFPPILLIALRFLVAAVLLLCLVRLPRRLLWPMARVAFVGATIQYAFTFYGLKYLDAGTTALIVQAEAPFLVLIAALWLREPMTARQWVGMAIAFVGLYLVSGQPQVLGTWWAVLLVLAGAFSWALGQVMVRQLGDVGGLTITAGLTVTAAPQLFLVSWIVESDPIIHITNAGWQVWGAVMYLGVVMTVIGYGCWYHVLGKYSAGRVAPFLLLTPVSSVLGGYWLLNEQLTPITLVGGFIIVSGVALLALEPGNDKVTKHNQTAPANTR